MRCNKQEPSVSVQSKFLQKQSNNKSCNDIAGSTGLFKKIKVTGNKKKWKIKLKKNCKILGHAKILKSLFLIYFNYNFMLLILV